MRKPNGDEETHGMIVSLLICIGLALPILGGIVHIIPLFLPFAVMCYITGACSFLAGAIWAIAIEGDISLDALLETEDADEKSTTT